MDRVVGIGEMVISDDMGDVIKTYALASCVAVVVYSPKRHVAGMIHVALPSYKKGRQETGQNRPCYYADLGVPTLFQAMHREYGCDLHELEIEIFGGACSVAENDFFEIGQKNIWMVKQIIKEYKLSYRALEVGGNQSRTLELTVATGEKKLYVQPLII